MFRIRQLYTEPATIDPVNFQDGVNFVLGVEDSSIDNTNGVGKTLCMEFVNFALLKQKSHSRLNRIPKSAFADNVLICIDVEICDEDCTIKRSLADSERPIIISSQGTITFAKLEDAWAYIEAKLYTQQSEHTPSFRSILGSLIRDERSKFISLVGCFDTPRRVPEDFRPHVYFLGLDVGLYDSIESVNERICEIDKDIKNIKENVKLTRKKDIRFAKADINELEKEVRSIEESIEVLENVAGYEHVKDEIIKLESKIEEKQREKYLLCQKLNGTKLMESDFPFDLEEVKEYYDRIVDRLGEFVNRDLEQVIEFQNKICIFQNQLIQEKRDELQSDIEKSNREISKLDSQYTSKLRLLDKKENLRNIKQIYSIFQAKSAELSELKVLIGRHDECVKDKEVMKLKKENSLIKLQENISDYKYISDSFEQSVLQIHEFVLGNRRASFDVRQTRFNRIVNFQLHVNDDGGHSIEREKVFIYDLALLLNEHTAERHLGILVHDHSFEVDQDTLKRNIMYLLTKADFTKSQQYIATLNTDKLSEEIKEKIEPYIRAVFTKENRFLKTKYKEVRNRR